MREAIDYAGHTGSPGGVTSNPAGFAGRKPVACTGGAIMRRGYSALLVVSLLLAAPAGAETASQVFQQVSPSVVVVLTYNAAGKAVELGSGVKLPDGSVATNCHVLKDGTTYRVRYRGKVYPASLDKADWNRDVCSLSVPGLPAPPVVLGSTKMLQVGAPVYAIGTPEGLQRTLSEGIVSSLRPVEGGSYIQTTAAISPGSSGGGLFDDHGRLLGLTSFFISKGQQLNFALPVEWIEALPQHVTPRIASGTGEVQWINRATALQSRKDWQGLQALAKSWVQAQPHSAIAWFALGEADDDLGQYAQAIEAYRQALQINPRYADAWYNLGVAYHHAGQYAQAIDAYRQALRINPRYADAWNNLGAAYIHAGQYTQAIDAERQALQINPRYANAWTNLGSAYDHAGQYAQAIEAYHQALQINPQDAEAWTNLGAAYADIGQYAQAIDAYRQALQINPQYADAWLGLGAAYIHAGQYAQAIDADRQALQINPQYALAWKNLGIAYVSIGQYAQAIDAYRQALQINPQNANAWFLLGLAYMLVGQQDQALAIYQHLKTLDPAKAQELFDQIVPR
jgi:tetratricopeptide (TPR) repeat protein